MFNSTRSLRLGRIFENNGNKLKSFSVKNFFMMGKQKRCQSSFTGVFNPSIESCNFDPQVPLDKAWTPPGSWYVDPNFLRYEKEKIFKKNWILAGLSKDLKNPGDYIAKEFMGEPYIIARGEDNKLRGFYNICRHHAAPVAQDGGSNTNQFVCCYHGWTYALDGKLIKATKLKGIKDFSVKDFGLVEFEVEELYPFVFLRFSKPSQSNGDTATGIVAPYIQKLEDFGYSRSMSDNIQHHSQRVYELNCNWKIVWDNYLDGPYHIPYLHPGLMSALEMSTYEISLSRKLSLQFARPSNNNSKSSKDIKSGEDFSERFASGPVYAFMYPNIAFNRMGPMFETNHVIPLGYDKTLIVFDYYFDKIVFDNNDFTSKAIAASHQVQVEDTSICEMIFRGMSSDGYKIGRYSPSMEVATYHFHQCLAEDLQTPDTN